jgi:hypothetical protein
MKYVIILAIVMIPTFGNANWDESAHVQYVVADFKYRTSIEKACVRWSCPPFLTTNFFLALMVVENQPLNPRAVSSSGAVGLMQIKPSTAGDLGISGGLTNEYTNILSGVGYLTSLVKRYKFRTLDSVALAYKEGPTAARRIMRTKFNISSHPYNRRLALLRLQ